MTANMLPLYDCELLLQAVLSLELAPEAAAAHTAALASLAPACKGAGSMPIQQWGQAVLAAAEAELHHALQVSQHDLSLSCIDEQTGQPRP